ncbi:uncharacterized protein LOC144123452 [Amblyomma americanum]
MDACVRRSPHLDICYEAPELVPCQKSDMKQAWWFYDGVSCKEWSFETGLCPRMTDQIAHYKWESDCASLCKGPIYAAQFHCYGPESGDACPVEAIKEAYFAYPNSNGSMECHWMDIPTIKKHRCIEENRRFDTIDDCIVTCVHTPPQGFQALSPDIHPIRMERPTPTYGER